MNSRHSSHLGGPNRIPGVSEILEVLNTHSKSLSVNLLGVPLADRPTFFPGIALAHTGVAVENRATALDHSG